jgi:uncharacterized protein (TIGR00251 family)
MAESGQLTLHADDGATRLTVRVIPRARKTTLDGVADDGALRVRITAPPVEGAANAALIALLADLLDVPKRDIAIVRGARGREKVVAISAPPARVRERLLAAAAPPPRGSASATSRA